MDDLEAVENLVRRARQERPPATDAGAGTILRIRGRRGDPVRILPLSLVAAAAAVAAAVVLTLAVHAWNASADPQAALFPTVEVAAL